MANVKFVIGLNGVTSGDTAIKEIVAEMRDVHGTKAVTAEQVRDVDGKLVRTNLHVPESFSAEATSAINANPGVATVTVALPPPLVTINTQDMFAKSMYGGVPGGVGEDEHSFTAGQRFLTFLHPTDGGTDVNATAIEYGFISALILVSASITDTHAGIQYATYSPPYNVFNKDFVIPVLDGTVTTLFGLNNEDPSFFDHTILSLVNESTAAQVLTVPADDLAFMHNGGGSGAGTQGDPFIPNVVIGNAGTITIPAPSNAGQINRDRYWITATGVPYLAEKVRDSVLTVGPISFADALLSPAA